MWRKQAKCVMKQTDTARQQRAKVKMPFPLPEICIGNHRSMAQNHMGLSISGKCLRFTVGLPQIVSFGFSCTLILTATSCPVDFTEKNQRTSALWPFDECTATHELRLQFCLLISNGTVFEEDIPN